jgi:hypothetical protein
MEDDIIMIELVELVIDVLLKVAHKRNLIEVVSFGIIGLMMLFLFIKCTCK